MLPSIHDFSRVTVPSGRRIALGVCAVLFFLCAANAATDHPATNTGVLPSEKPSGPAPARPREILAEVGIGRAELEKLQHTESILQQSDSRSVVLQILYRLAGMPLRNLEYWATENSEAGTREHDNLLSLGKTVSVSGRVTQIDAIALNDEDRARFGKTFIYRCQLSIASSKGPRRAILFVSVVPSQLPLGEPIDAACGALAIYLGIGKETTDLLLVADRLAWYPETLLGDLQMDLSLLENIQNSKPLRGEEYEAFYQMLAAAKRTAGGELVRRAYNQLVHKTGRLEEQQRKFKGPISPLNEDERIEEALLKTQLEYMRNNASHPFVPLVEYPDRFNGELIMLRGTAYRIVKVRINEPEIRKRFGIDHYYQIDMRVNLEHKVKLVTSRTVEGEAEKIREEKIVTQHPATFCALSLPPNMPTGDHLLEPIRVAGFYFKNWQYQTAEMRGDQAAERTAPMLIGREPVWDVRKPSEIEKYGGFIVGILFLLVLLGIWGVVWWTGRRDVAFGKKMRQASGGDASPTFESEPDVDQNPLFPIENQDVAPPGVDGENNA